MIRLFVSDIDGCLAMPYQPFRGDRLAVLARYTREAGRPGSHPRLPAVSLCSGRSYPYVEAMSQMLGVQTPVLFESGAGMFDPVSAISSWHPAFTPALRQEVDEIRHFLEEVVVRGPGMSVDYAKRSQAAMVGSIPESLEDARLAIEAHVQQHHPSFHTFHTHISVDVVPMGLTKAEGMQWLADTCDLDLAEMAFVGDTGGDVGALKIVGASFAPSNATLEARNAASHASSLPDIDAVLEAYERVSNGS